MGTVAHELSHFIDIGGTGDHGTYGVANARTLTATPSVALNNADNFEYCIERAKLK